MNPLPRAFTLTIMLTVSLLAQTPTQSLVIKNWDETMNYSGKTRMLSQRVAHAFGIQANSNMPLDRRQEAKEIMQQAQKELNDIYWALLSFDPIKTQSQAGDAVKAAQAQWRLMENVTFKTPTLDSFREMLAVSDTLLERNEKMTAKLEGLSARKASEIINIAGRQRMFSQKLMKDYLAASMEIDKRRRLDSMLETATEFESAMLVLEGASINTEEIKGAINSISKMEWRKVYQTVTDCVESNGAKFNVVVMVEFCETLLRKADRLTKLYVSNQS